MDRAVRVAVTVSLDDTATRWWTDRVRPARSQAERPRLVLVRSQGRLRGAVVLARRQGWRNGAGSAATVSFDLDPAELADGLLAVELAGPAVPLPDWAAGRLSRNGVLGLRIDRVTVRPATGAAPAGPVPEAHSALVVVPAGRTAEGLRLRAYRVPPAPPPPRTPGNRWTRQKPARAVFKVSRLARRVAGRAGAAVTPPAARPGRLGGHAVDLATGAAVPVTLRRTGADRYDVRLAAAAAGPVLLGLVDPAGVRRERSARQPAWRPVGGWE
ncbi:hypothetical protein CIK06_15515 [Plantactinospora sp. KBS50]|nr:hypothetical protein CIK06_15515 [Plantactinospora sp. KBS50]